MYTWYIHCFFLLLFHFYLTCNHSPSRTCTCTVHVWDTPPWAHVHVHSVHCAFCDWVVHHCPTWSIAHYTAVKNVRYRLLCSYMCTCTRWSCMYNCVNRSEYTWDDIYLPPIHLRTSLTIYLFPYFHLLLPPLSLDSLLIPSGRQYGIRKPHHVSLSQATLVYTCVCILWVTFSTYHVVRHVHVYVQLHVCICVYM